MPFWCLQNNECLACTGGCEGYETKHELMREQRLDFWRRVDKSEAKETRTMGYSDQEAKQALNTDTLLHQEPSDNGYWYNKLSLTRWGGISIDINGYVITKTMKQWHELAAADFKRQEEMAAQIKVAQNGDVQYRDASWWDGTDFGVIDPVAPAAPVKPPTFAQKLANLLNEASKENGSNTPDFVLAEYLTNCLGNFEAATKAREKFYGVSSRPGDPSFTDTPVTITKMEHNHLHAIEVNEEQARGMEVWPVI